MKLKADFLSSHDVKHLFSVYKQASISLLFVGGCVRNALVKAAIHDLDLATDAHPQDILHTAQASGFTAIPTGISHGTVTVIVGNTVFEITTFREDIITDGRHAKVQFTDEIYADAKRRDFTMNALYLTNQGELIDPLDGIKDAQDKYVRFIGDAQDRIKEDYLRILRFFRFNATFGNPKRAVDAVGLKACAQNVSYIVDISSERIGQELKKILSVKLPLYVLSLMDEIELLPLIIEKPSLKYLARLEDIETASNMSRSWKCRLALICDGAQQKKLALSNNEAKYITALQKLKNGSQSVYAMAYYYGYELTMDALYLRAAMGRGYIKAEIVESILDYSKQVFPIKASDLMPTYEGKALGEQLKKLEMLWVNSKFTMDKAELLALAL